VQAPSRTLATAVTDRIWPCVMLQWEWLGGLPPLRRAAVIGAGSWGTAVAVMFARAGLEVDLGCRTAEQANQVTASGRNDEYLPGVELPESINVMRAADLELSRHDLVAFAVPSAGLPSAVAAHGGSIPRRAGVLVMSKGLVPPLGTLASAFVAERVNAWAVGALAGPAHAAASLSDGASLVVGSQDPAFGRQVTTALTAAGFDAGYTRDVVGVELAGCAKNAAALAAAAAERFGLNAAGIAAAGVWRECVEFALAHGARLETFSGLAGVGDLTATVLAPQSRNRQAGELLGAGVPAEKIQARIGQASEGLDSVPLIAETVAGAGIEAPSLEGLAALIEGEIDAGEWIAGLRRAERARRAA
jgi:glycerol-3-phosphate dehydrogenase